MFYSTARRLAFVHVPHTGGTSIEQAYRNIAISTDIIDERADKHITALALSRRVDLTDWTIVAVTRNPWDRLHAHYHHAQQYIAAGYADSREPWRAAFAHALRRIRRDGSFARFVERWLTKPTASWEFYCRGSRSSIVNHVIRFDQLASGWARLLSPLGLASPLANVNHCAGRPDYRTAYDDQLVERVGNFCRVEIEQFGHEFRGKCNG
jgi:hypothetical protein